jgi:hypothetical protein
MHGAAYAPELRHDNAPECVPPYQSFANVHRPVAQVFGERIMFVFTEARTARRRDA